MNNHILDVTGKWKRPPLPATFENPAMTDLVFQQIEIDECNGPLPPIFHDINGHDNQSNVPYLRLYGVTEDGNSVACNIFGFYPYFYIPAPGGFGEQNIPDFIVALNVSIRNSK
jgi:DNA polymerase delta subunit 1